MILGIDLGTTNSLAAVWKDGKCVLIPNASSGGLTPSVVSVDEDGSILVGQAARERLISHPERTVACFKRTMGTRRRYELGEQRFSSEELSALVLRRLREDAESYLGQPVTEAVISVPAYFTEAQRAATKRAGQLAGLHVERLVNEPSAAALSGRLGQSEEDSVSLVFDLGGGTLDLSLVECFEQVVSVTAVSGDNHLGGADFDLAIAQAFCEECGYVFEQLPQQSRELVIRQAETCKMALSRQETVLMVVEDQAIHASVLLDNSWLIRKCSSLFRQMLVPVETVLRDAGITAADLDELVLVGGSCHMPSVRRYLTKTLGLEPTQNTRPDTAVALGAGICGAMKARTLGVRELVLTDVCPFTLGVATLNMSEPDRPWMSPIIERNSVLPTSRIKTYHTCSLEQENVDVQVYQGENPYCTDNLYLGHLLLNLPKELEKRQTVKVRFTYDINGLLEVEVNNEAGEMERLLLKNDGMSEEEIQRRREELDGLKLHPREQERPRMLIARAERLYASTVGQLRDVILQQLASYQQQLNTQDPLVTLKASKHMEQILNEIEDSIGQERFPDMQSLFEEDSEE